MPPNIYEVNPAARFYRKITGQSTLCTSITDSAQIITLFAIHARLSASLIISQQYHEFRVHTSVTFLIYGNERPHLMVCFLKRLETSPFRGEGFGGV